MKLHSDYVGKTTYSSSSGNHFSHINFAVASSLWFPCIVADACCNASYETYSQLNAMRSKWLQEAVPRADGNSLHNYYPSLPCIDCLVRYVVIVFVDLIYILFFIPCIRSGIRRCSYVVSFISSHLNSSIVADQAGWLKFVNDYIHVNSWLH